ncbi:hypothetical protein [Gibbsiella quercinecans]|uniref:hypothetical protein n=1 Tax=Gibbsiella quercinecans TaxID=929813 RepID=UPI003A4DFBA2
MVTLFNAGRDMRQFKQCIRQRIVANYGRLALPGIYILWLRCRAPFSANCCVSNWRLEDEVGHWDGEVGQGVRLLVVVLNLPYLKGFILFPSPRIIHYKRELVRKEKAQAEAAAILVLRKRLQDYYGETDGDD